MTNVTEKKQQQATQIGGTKYYLVKCIFFRVLCKDYQRFLYFIRLGFSIRQVYILII